MCEVYRIDIEKAIEDQKRIVENLRKEYELSNEEMNKARSLCDIYDSITKRSNDPERYERHVILHQVAKLLDFDYKAGMDLCREEDILEMYEEIETDGGFGIGYKNWDGLSVHYYFFPFVTKQIGYDVYCYYTDRIGERIKMEDLPDFILNNDDVKKLMISCNKIKEDKINGIF